MNMLSVLDSTCLRHDLFANTPKIVVPMIHAFFKDIRKALLIYDVTSEANDEIEGYLKDAFL